jgi:hypothetical protein
MIPKHNDPWRHFPAAVTGNDIHKVSRNPVSEPDPLKAMIACQYGPFSSSPGKTKKA